MRQCQMLAVTYSTVSRKASCVSQHPLEVMRVLDEGHLKYPFYGLRRLRDWLEEHGQAVNRKRAQRLVRLMGLSTMYSWKKTSQAGTGHRIYPYVLRNLTITQPNHVWTADVCYIPMAKGFVYLVAIMDWA